MDLKLKLKPNGDAPLYRQIEKALRSAIDSRQLAPGERIPSAVDLAKQLGVSPSWIYAVRQELSASKRSWHGAERRSGIDRRRADIQHALNHLVPQRRSGRDRRCHAI